MMRGDVLARLADMPDASVHCCVTSPPYYGLRDYGVAGQIGLEASPEAYIDRMVDVFREVRRVLRPDGTLWLNLGDSYAANGVSGLNLDKSGKRPYGAQSDPRPRWAKKCPAGLKSKDLMMMPARVALALQADGWYLRSEIIWHKQNPMPESARDRPTSAHEKIFLLAKSERYFYDAIAIQEPFTYGGDIQIATAYAAATGKTGQSEYKSQVRQTGRNSRNVWTVASAKFRGAHFATFPPTLIEPCILAGTSAHGVCDACGAPWARLVDRVGAVPKDTSVRYAHGAGRNDAGRGNLVGASTKTICWQPSCTCDAAIMPATVLDPFAGAGTVGIVADRLGRDSVLIEINPDYALIAATRIHDDAGLFAEVTYS